MNYEEFPQYILVLILILIILKHVIHNDTTIPLVQNQFPQQQTDYYMQSVKTDYYSQSVKKRLVQQPMKSSKGCYLVRQNLEQQIDLVDAGAFGLKVLSEVYDLDVKQLEIHEIPSKIIFQGVFKQVCPSGEINEVQAKNKNNPEILYKMNVKNQQQGIYEDHYFRALNFNYVTLMEISGMNKMLGQHEKKLLEQSKNRYNIIRQTLKKKEIKDLQKFNKKDFTFGLAQALKKKDTLEPIHRRCEEILANQLKLPISLNLENVEKEYIIREKYKLILPNYKVEESCQPKKALRFISKTDRQTYYYFSNPQLFPIFINDIPQGIKKHVQMKNEILTQKRMKAENNYGEQYILEEINTLKDKKVCVIIKYIYEDYKGMKQMINETGFNISFNFDKTIDYDCIWYISSNNSTVDTHQINFLRQQYQKGCGIFFWGDNQPYFGELNVLLKQLGFSFVMQGNYIGQNILRASKQMTNGTFDVNHPVSAGFTTLYEGITICYPSNITDGFQIFAYNSYQSVKQPAIIYRKGKKKQGTIWIDSGFTKMYPSCNKSNRQQVLRYITNATIYISKKMYL